MCFPLDSAKAEYVASQSKNYCRILQEMAETGKHSKTRYCLYLSVVLKGVVPILVC